MSHIPQRKETDCLNCGSMVQGKYCHVCGQENVVPRESFWHMVTHFFYDITHFDSNFFHTLHHLILKPGFLPKEYMAGKRARYLHPIKMYVFTSAIFFLLFFSVFQIKVKSPDVNVPLTSEERGGHIKRLQEKLAKDTGNIKLKGYLLVAKDTSQPLTIRDMFEAEPGNNVISFTGENFESFEKYDSVQKNLPSSKRDGWLARRLMKKQLELNMKYRENPDSFLADFLQGLLKRLPYLLFVSLPLFALLLKLVYVRRKQFYFADHAVFTIHLYIFSFILLLLVFTLDKLRELTGWGFFTILITLLIISLFAYLLIAMKRFYGQRWGKTFVKFLLVSILSLIMMVILLLIFMFFSAVIF